MSSTAQATGKRRNRLKEEDVDKHDVINNQENEGGSGLLLRQSQLDQSQVENDENQPHSLTNSPLRKKASNSSNNRSPFGRSQSSNSLNNLHNNNSNNNESLVPSPPAFAAGLSSKFSTSTNSGVSSLSAFSGVDIPELQSNHLGTGVSLSLLSGGGTTTAALELLASVAQSTAQPLPLLSNNVSATLSTSSSNVYFDGTDYGPTRHGKYLTSGTVASINAITENFVPTSSGPPKLRRIDPSRIRSLPPKGSRERERLVFMVSIARDRSIVGGNQPLARQGGFPAPRSLIVRRNSIQRPFGLNLNPCVLCLVYDPETMEVVFKATSLSYDYDDTSNMCKESSLRWAVGKSDYDDKGNLVNIKLAMLNERWQKRELTRFKFLVEPLVDIDKWKGTVVTPENAIKFVAMVEEADAEFAKNNPSVSKGKVELSEVVRVRTPTDTSFTVGGNHYEKGPRVKIHPSLAYATDHDGKLAQVPTPPFIAQFSQYLEKYDQYLTKASIKFGKKKGKIKIAVNLLKEGFPDGLVWSSKDDASKLYWVKIGI